ncbi:AlbA family DNA-binding domain-containing protein [Mycolicibacterium sp. ELW1]|uniref:AlbA family DNA-binding domain-containing protein n=1 Tax=Mycobacteriaceae TaxID=1762 RepID=UPI0011EEBFB5|nr:ATP-binding protein [Mycobacterium sp. ELW1]QEN12932.1 ATP-binding protein [Mycobacterium sp. ELW1]
MVASNDDAGKGSPVGIRRDPGGQGWYFGDKLRENGVYTNVFVARVSDLTGCSASELQRVMRREVRAGCEDPTLELSMDDEAYFDEEDSPIEPITFRLVDDTLAISFMFSTGEWIWDEIHAVDPRQGPDDEVYFDEFAAGSLILAEILAPLFDRNRTQLVEVEFNAHNRSPPWWWSGVAKINARGRKLDDLYRLGEDAIALIDAFNQSRRLTQETAVNLLRAGHARALVGQSESQWLEVKSQNFDLDTGVGQIKLARSVAKFANSELGGILVVGMAGKKIPGGEIIQRVCPVPLNGSLIRRYQQAIEHRLYPPPDRLSIESIGCGDLGLLLVIVPAQPEELKPFLVHGAIVDGNEEGTFISIVRRRGEASIPVTAPMIHSALAAGRALLRRGELPPER